MPDTARVTSLGHVGIAVQDLPAMIDFYTRILGLTVTDGGGPEHLSVFLSADPRREHHELVLSRRPGHANAQQISFTVDSLDDLRELYHAVRVHPGCSELRAVSHGNAISFEFRDLEKNPIEVYWPTGMDFVQPAAEPIDLEQGNDALLSAVHARAPLAP